jgi:membrane-associated phospholipid phosphatase
VSTAAAISVPAGHTRREWRRQAGLFLAAYLLYSAARWICVGDTATATRHAHWIVDLEKSLRANVESGVQQSLTGTPLLWLLNHVYIAAQLIVVPGSLIWLYRRNRHIYRQLRDTVLATWLVSVPVYAAYPVAPPRLAHIGMTDTITSQTGFAMDSSLTTSFYNPLAAVPSLHVGFAVAVGIALAAAVRSRWAKVAWLMWGPLVGLAVVATGNHFIFDVVAGVAATALGYTVGAVTRRVVRSRSRISPPCGPRPSPLFRALLSPR